MFLKDLIFEIPSKVSILQLHQPRILSNLRYYSIFELLTMIQYDALSNLITKSVNKIKYIEKKWQDQHAIHIVKRDKQSCKINIENVKEII